MSRIYVKITPHPKQGSPMWVAYNAEEKHYSLVASEHGKLIGVDGYN